MGSAGPNRARRLLLAVAAYFVALLLVGVVAFFIVMFLAGPHAGVLPQALEIVVLITGWLSVLFLPFIAAWHVWRRMGRQSAG